MNDINYTINDSADFERMVDVLDLKPGASIQTICIALLEKAAQEKDEQKVDRVTIEINPDLLAVSYNDVPAMLARSMLKLVPFPSLQSFKRDGQMFLIAAETRVPTTFKRRALSSIMRQRIFKVSKELVPRSYRRRPGILSKFLSEQTSYAIVNETRKNEIVWKIAE